MSQKQKYGVSEKKTKKESENGWKHFQKYKQEESQYL